MHRRLLAAFALVFAVLSAAAPVMAGAELDQAGAALRRDPVFVDPSAERPLTSAEADGLRRRIQSGQQPVFVAVLPASAISEAGGADALPKALHDATGLAGTYAVLAGTSFRAASSSLPSGQAATLATAAFQAHRSEGPAAVLDDFVRRVEAVGPGSTGSGSVPDTSGQGSTSDLVVGLVVIAAIAGLAIFFVVRMTRRTKQQHEEVVRAREFLRPELQVLADDVLALEPQVAIHEDAREDYDAALSRYRWAEAAMPLVHSQVDVDRLARGLSEGRYAMARAQAIIDGRQPPPPPPELTVPSPANDPPVVIVDNRPQYAGYGGGWYGGGWFGGNDLFTGILLGQMFGGGWGHSWGGGWGGGWGGSSSGGVGGGDFGGGGVGGGDFGGFGGGDFGGGGGSVGGGDF